MSANLKTQPTGRTQRPPPKSQLFFKIASPNCNESYRGYPSAPGGPSIAANTVTGTVYVDSLSSDFKTVLPINSNSKMSGNMNAMEKAEMLKMFNRKYEVPYYLQRHMSELARRDIVFIVDDSGSMGQHLDDHSIPRRDAKQIMAQTGLRVIRRWDELKYYLKIAVKLGICFDEDGIDLIGLNRGKCMNCANLETVEKFFAKDPEGATPLYARLKEVLDGHVPGTQKVIVIATDGVPNDRSLKEFKKLVKSRAGRKAKEVPIVFMICSDNDNDVDYLDSLDNCPWVGVVDDYETEKSQIRDLDRRRQYSQGGHIVNTLLNWVPDLDRMDEAQCAPCTII